MTASVSRYANDVADAVRERLAGQTIRACPVCNSRVARPLVTVPLALPDSHPLGSSFSVVSCDACGTGFTDADVSQAAYDAHYAHQAKYADDGRTNAGESAPDTPWNIKRLNATAARLSRWVQRDARLVDIGCATGSLLVALAEQGMHGAIGLDPSPGSAAVAAGRGVTVLTGTLADLPPELGVVDVVTMNGVFEHLLDVAAAVRAVTSVLLPGGLLYVEVPDAARYCHPYVAPFQDFNTEHVNHFSAVTLDRLLRRFGFEPLWQGDADAELGPGFVSATTAGAWRFAGPQSMLVPASPRRDQSRDEKLAAELVEYSNRSARDMAATDRFVDEQLGAAEEVAVWGIGEVAYKLLAMPALASRRIVNLIDGNTARHGMRIRGIEVTGPESLTHTDAPVVVSSVLAQASITAELTRRGFTNHVVGLAR